MTSRSRTLAIATWIALMSGITHANPHPDESRVPKVDAGFWQQTIRGIDTLKRLTAAQLAAEARPMLRLRLDWDQATESYRLGTAVLEESGTDALYARGRREDELGSYKGYLTDAATGSPLSYDSIGTGQEFRRLTRAITFRFPAPDGPVNFRMQAENPQTGVMEDVLTARLDPRELPHAVAPAVEVRELRAASREPKVVIGIYAEGYKAAERERFFQDAARIPRALSDNGFPMQEHFEVRAVFAPSVLAIGTSRDLGQPVRERDSFLGLYFPYWRNFGRWYHVVYPTREERFRAALATSPYDYPIALVNDTEYWGVGNYRELTAIPARSSSFVYLLLHEIGHYFGLNEEYESGGPTELAFAPDVFEPWSQNITFLRDPSALKWHELIDAVTPVPTPASRWRGNGPLGAYPGGYAQTEPQGISHKPGMACTMGSGQQFCSICRRALEQRVTFDVGG